MYDDKKMVILDKNGSSESRDKNRKICKIHGSSLDIKLIDYINGKIPLISHIDDDAPITTRFSRILDPATPRIQYETRKLQIKRTLHWGQLKLMLTEIEFIILAMKQQIEESRFIYDRIYLIYAGAAPGNHIRYLQKLFPNVQFELYDPNRFAIKSHKNINLHNRLFTNEDAKYWTTSNHPDKYIIFCSDIRREPATESNVKLDMGLQLSWWEIMSPELTMFKFRLPWHTGNTEYPKGDIYLQPFPGHNSTETRLIVKKNAPIISYDNQKYEEQMFYHNTILRKYHYKSLFGTFNMETDHLDNCYDCTTLMHVIHQYLTFVKYNSELISLRSEMLKMSKDIQSEIAQGKQTILSQTIKNMNNEMKRLHTIFVKPTK
jgi:hypothetical protein